MNGGEEGFLGLLFNNQPLTVLIAVIALVILNYSRKTCEIRNEEDKNKCHENERRAHRQVLLLIAVAALLVLANTFQEPIKYHFKYKEKYYSCLDEFPQSVRMDTIQESRDKIDGLVEAKKDLARRLNDFEKNASMMSNSLSGFKGKYEDEKVINSNLRDIVNLMNLSLKDIYNFKGQIDPSYMNYDVIGKENKRAANHRIICMFKLIGYWEEPVGNEDVYEHLRKTVRKFNNSVHVGGGGAFSVLSMNKIIERILKKKKYVELPDDCK